MLTCVCVCASGSVRCSQWTGPPSLASWYGSVRVRAGWGRDLGAICSLDMATAASKCGTWPLRWTLLTKERRGRRTVRKRQIGGKTGKVKRKTELWINNNVGKNVHSCIYSATKKNHLQKVIFWIQLTISRIKCNCLMKIVCSEAALVFHRCRRAYRGGAAAAVGPVRPEHLPLCYTKY